jgi:hypothetical protein
MGVTFEGQPPIDQGGKNDFPGLSFWNYKVSPPTGGFKKGRLGINFPKGTDIRANTDSPNPPYEVEYGSDGTIIVSIDVAKDDPNPITIQVVSPTARNGGRGGMVSVETKTGTEKKFTVIETVESTIPLQVSQTHFERTDGSAQA